MKVAMDIMPNALRGLADVIVAFKRMKVRDEININTSNNWISTNSANRHRNRTTVETFSAMGQNIKAYSNGIT